MAEEIKKEQVQDQEVQEAQDQEQAFWEKVDGRYFEELEEKLQKELKRTNIQIGIIRTKKRRGRYYFEKDTRNIATEQLKDMWENGEILLPKFQRGKVWDIKKKSELIYTLLAIGIIPEILIVEDKKGNKYLIDGWQRTSTIIDYFGNLFKLKLDPNLEHIDPYNTDETQILKNLFERINYKSTPLSKYRIVLLTIYSLSNLENKKEREDIEDKISAIQETAYRIKEEDRQESNLGFILRVLTGIKTYELYEENSEMVEELKGGKNFTDYMIEVLKDYIREIDKEELQNILERIYEVVYILTNGKVRPIASPKGQKNAEAIALFLYQMKKKGLLEYSILDNDENIDFNEIKETIEILKGIEDEALAETGRKNPTATKDVSLYITATERLFRDRELINWEKIILDMEKALQFLTPQGEEKEKVNQEEEEKEETPEEQPKEEEKSQEIPQEEKKPNEPNINVFENLE